MAVSRLRKSLSFNRPNPTPQIFPGRPYHVRSVSLPCRKDPLISQLKDEINELKTWESRPNARNSSWLNEGLTRLKKVHDSVDDILQIPETQESLRRRSDWVEKLLEDFLRLVDAYGIFRAALMNLREEQSTAQVSIRRRGDESKIGSSYVKSQNKMEKEMEKLVSSVRYIGRSSSTFQNQAVLTRSSSFAAAPIAYAELAEILKDVTEVTVSVSVCVFNGISSRSSAMEMGLSYCHPWMGLKLWKRTKSSSMGRSRRRSSGSFEEFEGVEVKRLKRLRKQGDEEVRRVLMKLEALENCIGEIEMESERVFRSLINTRVSLLNILTQ